MWIITILGIMSLGYWLNEITGQSTKDKKAEKEMDKFICSIQRNE